MTFYWTGLGTFTVGAIMQLIVWGPAHPVFWGPVVVAVPFFAWAYRECRRQRPRGH